MLRIMIEEWDTSKRKGDHRESLRRRTTVCRGFLRAPDGIFIKLDIPGVGAVEVGTTEMSWWAATELRCDQC